MKKYVYIMTDCNRKCLQVGMTDNILRMVKLQKEACALFFNSNEQVSRLVYVEEFISEEPVLERLSQLQGFTRAQKERLIRAANTNWIDLSLHFEGGRPPERSQRLCFREKRHNSHEANYVF